MIEPVENRSMLVKLKPCTFSNSSWRRFLAKPAPAIAANLPARKPAASEHSEHARRIRPNLTMAGMLLPVMPSSINDAITVGMRISRTPSTTTNIGVRMLGFLYSRSDLPSVRTRCRFCFGCDCTAAVVTFVPLTYSSFPVSSSCDVFRTVGCDSHSRDCRSHDSASHNARLE